MSADDKNSKFHVVFVVLDLDRTLIDSSLLARFLVEYYAPEDQWEQEIAAIEAHRGGSYDALTFLHAKYGQKGRVDASKLVELHGWKYLADTLLLPGASAVFHELDSRAILYGIFTKGGKDFQALKVALLCAMVGEKAIPHLVTSSDQKAAYITKHWWDENEKAFTVPGQLTGASEIKAHRVIIVDDKLENLTPSHGAITPYHVSVNTVQTFIDSIDQIIYS